MCGIAGFVGTSIAQSDGRTVLDRMVARLTHRGPDADGLWADGPAFLGMRRLSIVDLAGGGQPLFNEDGSIALVFNGEIYNHRALRRDLTARGHQFRTDHADGEVIAHLYEEMGSGFVTALNGMFAVALWDRRRQTLTLARDRAGIKPLYVAETPSGVVFGSEPKALLTHPEIGTDPDFAALHHYFSFKNIPAPQSAFKSIGQLRPGELAQYTCGERLVRRIYWQPRFSPAAAEVDEASAQSTLRALLEDAVALQMEADVPVGAFLSGGIDSSAVATIAARRIARPLKTFTLVYEDGRESAGKAADRHFARLVAQRIGSDHVEHRIGPNDIPAALDGIIAAFDEPYSGVISTYFLSAEIARHVKVALSGDGADELFGSYLPHRLAQPLAAAAQGDWPNGGEFAADRLAGILARGDEAARRMACYLADDRAVCDLYTPWMAGIAAQASSEALIRRHYAASDATDPVNRALDLDQRTLLPDQVLAFVDRLSMAHSLEVRPPFLDHRFVEAVNAMPGSLKIRRGRVKSLLKDSLRGLLPDDLLDRPKEGFVMPIQDWLNDALAPLIDSLLSAEGLARQPVLDAAAVGGVLARFRRGDRSLAGRVWNLAMFQLWWQRFQNRGAMQ